MSRLAQSINILLSVHLENKHKNKLIRETRNLYILYLQHIGAKLDGGAEKKIFSVSNTQELHYYAIV